jgi:hypothetical protein
MRNRSNVEPKLCWLNAISLSIELEDEALVRSP